MWPCSGPSWPDWLNETAEGATAVTLRWGAIAGRCDAVFVSYVGDFTKTKGQQSVDCRAGRLTLDRMRSNEMYRLTVWVESRWETARVETERREMAAYTGMWEGEGERGGGGGGEGCTG